MKIRALTAVLATIVAAALTGCGNSQTPDSAPASPGGTGAQPASGHAANTDVCTALPAAAVSQITGTTFTTTKSSSVAGLIFSCEYGGPDSALLQVSVQIKDGKQAYGTDVSALTTVSHPPTPVTGVGDEAFSEPDPKGNAGSAGASAFASYGAVFGGTYVKIGGLTYVTANQGKQIAEQLHSQF
ncbi:MAG TPA: hypothetical protein VNF47_04240 [Streptosporangiaceae bacterium]|nr:hypothetical protein [Streptosporangiaceae bacterium]